MRQGITALGVIILVFGLVMAAAGTRTTYDSIEHTETLLNSSPGSLSPYYYIYYYDTFDEGEVISGTVEASQPVNFYIFSNEQFNDWQTYYSYSSSAPSIVTRTSSTNMAFSVTISSTDTYYLVVHNNDGYTGCTIDSITIDRTYYETVERRDYSLNIIGGILAIVGIIVAVIGGTRKSYEEEALEITSVEPVPVSPTTEPTTEPKAQFCPSCGSEVPAGTEFCPHCGSAV